jgi:hypothetical protein
MWSDNARRRRTPPSRPPADSPNDGRAPGGEDIDAASDGALQRLAAPLRQGSPVLDAELDRRIMAAIRDSPRWRARAALAWWLRPRPIRLSPFGAFLAASALAALMLVVVHPGPAPAPRAAPSTTEAGLPPPTASTVLGVHVVRFVLAAPGAAHVSVVGDFNGWDAGATPLRPVGAAGVWTVEVPLTAGRHEYAFVIDGREWRPDPSAPRAAADDYGSPNSVITVGAHST